MSPKAQFPHVQNGDNNLQVKYLQFLTIFFTYQKFLSFRWLIGIMSSNIILVRALIVITTLGLACYEKQYEENAVGNDSSRPFSK